MSELNAFLQNNDNIDVIKRCAASSKAGISVNPTFLFSNYCILMGYVNNRKIALESSIIATNVKISLVF